MLLGGGVDSIGTAYAYVHLWTGAVLHRQN